MVWISMSVVLAVVVLCLAGYLLLLKKEIRNISFGLKKRYKEKTRELITVEFINKDLNHLAANINKSLQAEETLRLQAVQEEKEFKEMIANISHDLRTPLTAVKGYIDLVDRTELTEEQKYNIGIAKKHAENLGRLIEHFFEYSYLVNSDPEVRLQKINLTNLVTELLVASVTSLEEEKIEVVMKEERFVYVQADQEMLARLIQNLIRNCVAHGKEKLEVNFVTDEEKSKVKLHFANRIKGEQTIDAARVFERFYTGDTSRAKSAGLGLSIVKLLAEKMGGKVEATVKNGWIDIAVELNRVT